MYRNRSKIINYKIKIKKQKYNKSNLLYKNG